jgi:hypothetical protein
VPCWPCVDTGGSALSPRAATLVLYLLAIGDIAVGNRTPRPPGVAPIEVMPDWTEQLFRARAPYLFEPVAAVYPMPGLTILLSPVDGILGGVLGGLVGLNLAVAADTAARTSCRRGYGRVLAAVRALLTGMACCVPTFVVVAGGSVAATFMPDCCTPRAWPRRSRGDPRRC